MQTSRKILGGVCVSVRLKATNLTAKRLLIGSVLPVCIRAHLTLLRGVRTLDLRGSSAALGRIPLDLLGEMPKIGGIQIGIHRTCLELHRGNRKLFIGQLGIWMLIKALVDSTIDLLSHMATETLATGAAG